MAWTHTPTKHQFRAVFPEPARPIGTTPAWRSSRKVAQKDLADALRRYMAAAPHRQGTRAAWADWAFRLGAGLTASVAPDGSTWQIEKRARP